MGTADQTDNTQQSMTREYAHKGDYLVEAYDD